MLRWINNLYADGEVHIGNWVIPANGGPATPVYHRGPGPDVPCTLLVPTAVERKRQHRQRQREDGEWELVKARRRVSYYMKRATVRRDPLMVGLFGPIGVVQ